MNPVWSCSRAAHWKRSHNHGSFQKRPFWEKFHVILSWCEEVPPNTLLVVLTKTWLPTPCWYGWAFSNCSVWLRFQEKQKCFQQNKRAGGCGKLPLAVGTLNVDCVDSCWLQVELLVLFLRWQWAQCTPLQCVQDTNNPKARPPAKHSTWLLGQLHLVREYK